MALFLLIDLDRYAAFLRLSTAGKSIASVLTIWSVFSGLMGASVDFFTAVIAIGDIFSIFAYMHIMKGVRKQGGKNEEDYSDAPSHGDLMETIKTQHIEINKLKEGGGE